MGKKGRFKKGVSGNPAGRPESSRNWKTLIAEALNETITIKENGKDKRVTIAEIVMKSFVKKCLSGDPASFDLLLDKFTKVDTDKEVFALKMGKDLQKLDQD